jgi:transcriptional regulator with XRE-family HTH domain
MFAFVGGSRRLRRGTLHMLLDDEGRHFGHRLRETRLGAGLSQSELEELSGIPKARLSRYENGHVEPSIQTLARLARALNVSEASLLGDRRAAMEDFFRVLEERGISLTSKEQAARLAEATADMVQARGGIEKVTGSGSSSGGSSGGSRSMTASSV